MTRIVSKSSLQTQRFAGGIARQLLVKRHHTHAAVVALSGDLGAGKTTFAQGFAWALGIRARVASPTFVLFRRYKINVLVPERGQKAESKDNDNVALRPAQGINYEHFYHVDAYRLRSAEELVALGFKKILADPKNIVLIEWPENVRKLLPRDTIMVRLEHGKKASERILTVAEQISPK